MNFKQIAPLILASALLILSCGKSDAPVVTSSISSTDQYSGEQVRKYFDLLCTISKSTSGFFPPEVSRAYGYIGIVNYEAVVNGIAGAQSLGGQLNGLNAATLSKTTANQKYNWEMVSNTAIAAMIRDMFQGKINASNSASVDSMKQRTSPACLPVKVQR